MQFEIISRNSTKHRVSKWESIAGRCVFVVLGDIYKFKDRLLEFYVSSMCVCDRSEEKPWLNLFGPTCLPSVVICSYIDSLQWIHTGHKSAWCYSWQPTWAVTRPPRLFSICKCKRASGQTAPPPHPQHHLEAKSKITSRSHLDYVKDTSLFCDLSCSITS